MPADGRLAAVAMALFLAVATATLSAGGAVSAKPIDNWVRESIARLNTIRPALSVFTFSKGIKSVSLRLRIKVDKQGKIVFVRVAKSSGVPALDERARQLVLQLQGLSQPPPSPPPPPPHILDLPIIVLKP